MLVTFFCSEVFFLTRLPARIMVCFMVTQCSKATVRKKRDIYLFRFLSLSGLSLARFKITADILIAFAGEFFTEEIEDTESL